MIKITKKKQNIRSIINFKKKYTFNESINILKKFQTAKFNESIDTAIHLGIDPKKSDQNIRGSTVLPHGTGKKIKIAVFTKGNNIEKAKQSGANIVGGEELIKTITKKNINFDIVIASPDIMNILGKLGPILGPKGLMPNLKMGTITQNIEKTIKNIQKGQIIYKNDKNGIIHSTIGKINFSNQHLKENFINLIESLKKNKPTQSKGIFIKKIILSSTMGAGISIEINSIDEQ